MRCGTRIDVYVSDGTPVLQQTGQFLGVEVGQAGPQPDVRGEGDLGLHADQVLDGFEGGGGPAFEQPLALEGGAVLGSQTQLRHG